jgi:amino acid transporter
MFLTRIKRLLIGEPLTSLPEAHQKLPKWRALAVFSSDALSSIAYATEEMLLPLAAVSSAAMMWSIPVALGIAFLLLVVTLSFRETIEAYPGGGGAYVVAKQNLGEVAGLIAGGALLIDYVLTVAVSAAAGSSAFVAAFTGMAHHREGIGLTIIAVVTILNLRGSRRSGLLLAIPTWLFIGAMVLLIAEGAWKLASGQAVPVNPIIHEAYPAVGLWLILRAFSSGCAALTGIEAISNNVVEFQTPMRKNAKATLAWMAFVLAIFFISVTILARLYGIMPRPEATALGDLSGAIFGAATPLFYFVQVSTLLILALAAHSAYHGFPVLCSSIAQDRFLPRQFASLGDKLVFSNGILGLSLCAGLLIVIFEGSTHALIPLYAVGVFLSFTLSQWGMVVHHLRSLRKPETDPASEPRRRSRTLRSIAMCAIGGSTTGIVALVIASTKFIHGAWVVLLLVPALVLLFLRIRAHYLAISRELSLVGQVPPGPLQRLKHTVVIPISGIHRGVLDALRYAISISEDVRAVYVELDPAVTERVQGEWRKWAQDIPFVVLKSPFRSVIRPLIEYINDVEQITHDEMITVIIPEFVTTRWWHRLLHNQTALLIRTALMFKKGKVVTSVRYHLRES